MKIFIGLVVLLFAGCSTLKSPTSRVKVITSGLNALSGKEVWMGFNLQSHPVIIITQKDQMAFRYLNGKVQKWKYELIPDDLKTRKFSFVNRKIEDIDTMLFNLDANSPSPDEIKAIATIIHEGFHFFFQTDKNLWKTNQNETMQRGGEWPIKSKPRYYRWKMLQSLLSYYEQESDEHLKQYSAWYFKWMEAYPNQFRSYLDRHEGSAQYVMVKSLAHHSKEATVRGCVNVIEKFYPSTMHKASMDLGGESYILGAITGCILDSLKNSLWQKEVEAGKSSQQVLAEVYKSNTKVIGDKTELKEFEILADDKMKEMDDDGTIHDFVNKYQAQKLNFISINITKLQRLDFSARGFYLVDDIYNKGESISFIKMLSPSDLQSTDGSAILRTEKPNPTLQFHSNPCVDKKSSGSTHWVYSVDKIHFAGHRLKAEFKDITLYKDPTSVKNKNGALWLCFN